MASAVAELEEGLKAMSTLKAPGVSGTRIQSLTALCVANVQSESVLIQKIYTHFKKTDGDHKLGVLYVVDSVTRKWLEQAKAQGQAVDGSARDGTYAAGVHRVSELMPVLMTDIIQTAPQAQKEKIAKLIDIWEKGQTFPQPMIDSFKSKLASTPIKSTTPDGSPPPGLAATLGFSANKNQSHSAQPTPPTSGPAAPPSAAPNSNAIMEALANIARNTATAPPSNPDTAAVAPPASARAPPPAAQPPSQTAQPAAPSTTNLSNLLSSLSQQQQQQPPAPSTATPPLYHAQQAPAPPVPQQTPSYQYPPPVPGQGQGQQGVMPPNPQGQAGGFPGMPPPPPGGMPGQPQDLQKHVALIKALSDQGMPFEQISTLLQTMQATGALQPAVGGQTSGTPPQPSYPGGQAWGGPSTQSNGSDPRDRYGYSDRARSPDRYQGRSRSQSPGRRWDAHGSPRGGRDEYGNRRWEDRNDGRNGGRGSDYRQRSPAGRRGRSPGRMSPPQHDGHEKWVEYDHSLKEGHIRVFSRTLFVGGVTCSESELRGIFNQYGQVQTCIVNRDKRHAFVKMLTRRDAVAAKKAMEHPQGTHGLQLRTRWGVGYGPRHCSDYTTGVSIIPITALTDADRKWMLTAEFGGSDGKPIETGLVVEEPDIEIGAGVSSKAISRRIQTDKGGSRGPKSSRIDDDGSNHPGGGNNRWRHKGGGRQQHDEQASGANAQPLPPRFPYDGAGDGAGAGVGAGGFNGMPGFPQGFTFPGAPGGQS